MGEDGHFDYNNNDNDNESTLTLCSLLCQEDNELACSFSSQTALDFSHTHHLSSSCSCSSCCCYSSLDCDEVDQFMENLFQRETPCFRSATNCVVAAFDDGWLRLARLDAIDWILNTRALFGFRFHTAYLSITYFDKFLSKRTIDEGKLWAIRLLSVACLSIAAKMEECRVPSLSEFPTKDYCFENKIIKRMELLVLATLEWKVSPITPFSYIHHFIVKFHGDCRPKDLEHGVVELIMAMMKKNELLDYQPSIVAAAAVLAALSNQLTRKELELKINVIPSFGSVENEHIHSCYVLMKVVGTEIVKTPSHSIMSDVSLSSTLKQSGSIDVGDDSTYPFPNGVGIKRRLKFEESDHNLPVKKISQ